MIFGLAFLPSVFRLFTYRRRDLVSSFNMENDQRIKAHLLRWFFSHSLKIHDFRSCIFGYSIPTVYLPNKTLGVVIQIWKIISESRRIFWDGFQPLYGISLGSIMRAPIPQCRLREFLTVRHEFRIVGRCLVGLTIPHCDERKKQAHEIGLPTQDYDLHEHPTGGMSV